MVLVSHKIQTNHFIMKKLLLFALVFPSLLANAQQQTFEFFRWNAIQHPLENWRSQNQNSNGVLPLNQDEKGRTWYSQIENTKLKWYNFSDTTTIKITISAKQKAGYSYNSYANVIDESKTKLASVVGYKYVNSNSYVDSYIIKYDTLGQTNYLYQKDLGVLDSSTRINQFHSVSGKVLAILTNGKYIWEGNISANLSGYQYPTLINDKKGTLFSINTVDLGLYSFHSDGSYQKRLQNEKIVNFSFNQTTGTLTVITRSGVFELNGKIDKAISIPLSSELLKSSFVTPASVSKGNLKLDILQSRRGFNIKEGNSLTTYLFKGKAGIDSDSLNYTYDSKSGKNLNLQDDSTLVLAYFATLPTGAPIKYFLFTYKKGIVTLHKQYDLVKLKLAGVYQVPGFYVGKDQTHIYFYDGNIKQVKSDTIVTTIPTTGNSCNVYAMNMKADKDFLWIANEADTGKCAIARLRHDAYYVRGKVFYDSNKNGYKDNNEFGYSKIKLIAQPSGLQLTPDYDGNYAFKGEQGKSYTVEVVDSNRFSSIIKESYYSTIGVKLKDEKPEVNTSFWLPRARCFTNRPSSFLLQNVGVLPVEKVVIRLIPNKMKLLQNSALVDTATFTYQNLGVHQSASLAYEIEWPEAELTGQTATLKTITDLYVNGTVASRKIDSVQTIIRCSYDPNDKSVTPSGISDKLYTLKNSTLQYQIRFENTGNDTAYHVMIQDTLNSNLDFSTFEVLGSSHKMNVEISKNGVVGFHFNYINLPDSTTDKQGAQGYVRFSIKPKTTVANNTLLCNKAAIYFDLNKPVITNSTCNLLVDKIPTNPLGIETSESLSNSTIYPNPTSDWVFLPKDAEETTIYNTLGSQVLKSAETKVNMAGFEEGIYVAKVRAKNGKVSTHKLSVVK